MIRPEPKSKKELFTEKLRFLQSNYDSLRMPVVYFEALSLISGGKNDKHPMILVKLRVG
jgi:hypothetical protein